MERFTNHANIPLAMAVWLVQDDYDYINEPNYISATSLLRPIRSLVLSARAKQEGVKSEPTDLQQLIPSRLGTSIHSGVEAAWSNGNHIRNMQALGYPESVVKRVLVNPTPEQIAAVEDPILVYAEQRYFRELDGYKIGGKFDLTLDGQVNDYKSTSVYSWIYGGRDEDYILQGSIYRWLKPTVITDDHMQVNYVFTDWQKTAAASDPNYPQARIQSKVLPLKPLNEIEQWIKQRLGLLKKFWNAPQTQLPRCTDEELWRSDPKFKYFSDPTKTQGRSTKNFDSLAEANAFQASKGKGVVVVVPGEVKRCLYCPAYAICEQRKEYFND